MCDGIISKERVKQFGEVFTPDSIVCDMIDLVEKQWGDISDEEYISKTYLEPACGDGQFLIRILSRKLERVKNLPEEQREFALIKAVASIYGVDIQSDNVANSIDRMWRIINGDSVDTFDIDGKGKYICVDSGVKMNEQLENTVKSILNTNIILGNTLEEDRDSKDYVWLTEYEFGENTVKIRKSSIYEKPDDIDMYKWGKEVTYTELESLLDVNKADEDGETGYGDF